MFVFKANHYSFTNNIPLKPLILIFMNQFFCNKHNSIVIRMKTIGWLQRGVVTKCLTINNANYKYPKHCNIYNKNIYLIKRLI